MPVEIADGPKTSHRSPARWETLATTEVALFF